MQAIWTAIIAVAGTLLGSAATYFFQLKSSVRSESFMFQQQLRTERITAYSDFIRDITALARVSFQWRKENPEADTSAEVDRLRSSSFHAFSRIKLVTDDPSLVSAASKAFQLTRVIHTASTNEELNSRDRQANDALNEFIRIASRNTQTNPTVS